MSDPESLAMMRAPSAVDFEIPVDIAYGFMDTLCAGNSLRLLGTAIVLPGAIMSLVLVFVGHPYLVVQFLVFAALLAYWFWRNHQTVKAKTARAGAAELRKPLKAYLFDRVLLLGSAEGDDHWSIPVTRRQVRRLRTRLLPAARVVRD